MSTNYSHFSNSDMSYQDFENEKKENHLLILIIIKNLKIYLMMNICLVLGHMLLQPNGAILNGK